MPNNIIRTTIKFKRGIASRWTEANPVLAEGEPGFESDTGKLKIGNGIDAWNLLPYLNGEPNIDLSDYLRSEDISSWAKQPTKPTYTKAEIGLGNVDNTADIDKPVSSATQAALNAKQDTIGFDTDSSDATSKGYVDALISSIQTALSAKQDIIGFDTTTSDATSKGYVDTLISSIQTVLNTKQNIISFDTVASDAATKGYVDTLFNSIRNVNEVSY